LHEFECLSRELETRGIGFEAIFMAETERERYWRFHSRECSFKHRVMPGMTFYLEGGTPFHFNPRILLALIKRPPDWLLLGGAWYIPTVVAASLIAKIRGKRTSVFFWSESWAEDYHRVSGRLGLAMKRMLVGAYDGFVVPGEKAKAYVKAYARTDARCMRLANSVDERLYHDCVIQLRADRPALREKYQLPEDGMVFLWPARLATEKGILRLLEAVRPLAGAEYTILIAGEGPQRPEIEKWLAQAGEKRVRLLGHQDIERLLELYAVTDVLMLPSLSEPYGFAAVEGIWAGLPLLLSDKVGAWPEVMEPGQNGWLIDPGNPDHVRAVFQELLASSPARLEKMGEASVAIARERFSSAQSTREFVDELLERFPKKNIRWS
jgi:glycosyltransferase involved in cell wall biosynthesis